MTRSDLLIRMRRLHDELVSINDDLSIRERIDEETIDALGQLVTDVGELVENASENVADEHQNGSMRLGRRRPARPGGDQCPGAGPPGHVPVEPSPDRHRSAELRQPAR